mmetsp:Transcript_25858/g.59774  ORF Transcript_25858/g.59774 Transcript_25858/m.59774 type:complete len:237 (+) Transcript_25858:124-834(+)
MLGGARFAPGAARTQSQLPRLPLRRAEVPRGQRARPPQQEQRGRSLPRYMPGGARFAQAAVLSQPQIARAQTRRRPRRAKAPLGRRAELQAPSLRGRPRGDEWPRGARSAAAAARASTGAVSSLRQSQHRPRRAAVVPRGQRAGPYPRRRTRYLPNGARSAPGAARTQSRLPRLPLRRAEVPRRQRARPQAPLKRRRSLPGHWPDGARPAPARRGRAQARGQRAGPYRQRGCAPQQ